MNWIHRTVWIVCRIVFSTWFRWRIYNPENVPRTGSAILAANHASLLDPPLIGSALPRPMHYLARESLFHNRILKTIIEGCNAVPVDRDGGGGKGLKAILNRLKNGGAIILFPEGTRTLDGELQAARAGIGLSIIKSNAPVIPVRVFGTFEALGRHHAFPRPYRVGVKYGNPLTFEKERSEAKSCDKQRLKEIYQEAATKIMDAIAALEPKHD